MTDHWRGAAEQTGRDLARVKDERDQLRGEVQTLAAENGALRDEVEQLRTAARLAARGLPDEAAMAVVLGLLIGPPDTQA